MTKADLTENQAATHEQHYRTLLTILPSNCPDRDDLASTGAWHAVLGYNPSLIGKVMGRGRDWVRRRLAWLKRIMEPYSERG